ncbi:DUF1758 domain-containing protein [Trichonephila clavipes]|nr:DUF1758 domain-containing protein [Trichonephila clavipes]
MSVFCVHPSTPPPTMEPNKGRQPAGQLTCVRHGTYLRGGTGYSKRTRIGNRRTNHQPIDRSGLTPASRLRRSMGQRARNRNPRLHFPPVRVAAHGKHADASKSAYGTILYLRFVTCNNEIETSFICSKSRVAPLKSLTLPRLELTAALLPARLAKQVSSCLKFDANIYYWTDSLISYYWIRGDSSAFKPYIKNRVQEIQLLSDPMQWGHCPGKDNPGDLLSRGTSAVKLAQNELWWHGPPWLKLTPDHWPNRHRDILDSELCSEELEHCSSVHVAVT